MAEEKQAAAANEEAPPAAETQADAAREKARPKKLPVGKIILLLVTLVVYAGMVFISSVFTGRVVVPRVSAWIVDQQIRQITEQVEAKEVPPFGAVYIIEDLVVNPAGSGGTRYVCVSIGLESADLAVIEEIQTRDAQIKDHLIQVLGSKTVDELVNVESRERIRQDIKTRVEDVLPPGGLDAVYFVNFVLQ